MAYSARSVLTQGKKKSSAFLGLQEKKGEKNLHDISILEHCISKSPGQCPTQHLTPLMYKTSLDPWNSSIAGIWARDDPLLPWEPQAHSTARDHGTTHYKH